MAVWAGLRNPSTAPMPAQASPHNPHQEGICRAPSLSSFRRIQAEHFGSFSCFSHLCSLLELIYPSGSQSFIQEGHVLPL